jgi:putative ABC transport system substrate-binding protein
MRRRAFIEGIAALATAWPLAVRAQQSTTVRRVGVLMNYGADEPEGQARVRAFTQGLQKLGWSEGSNLRIDTRWTAQDPGLNRRYAAELVQSAPDVILASASSSVAALQQVTRSVPIVFANVVDQSTGPHHSAVGTYSRRRGDRIATFFAVRNVCFWHKADVTSVLIHVRFRR